MSNHSSILTRTTSGARDLFNGVPDLRGAKVAKVLQGDEDDGEYRTTIVLELANGLAFNIVIKQD